MYLSMIIQKSTFGLIATAFIVAFLSAATANAQESDAKTSLSGTWEKISFTAAGTWSIVEGENGYSLMLSEDFRTRGAPDLKLFLSPLPANQITGANATNDAVLIAPLSEKRGAQSYPLPEGINLEDFKSIVIHCQAYSKAWSASNLF